MKRLSLLATALTLAACSAGTPADRPDLDVLTEGFARARAEVPAFGGVAVEGAQPVVLTLGDEPAALPAVRAIFGDAGEVRARAEYGGGSEALKDQISQAVSTATYVDFDETVGYVRLGVADAAGVARAYDVLRRAGLPVSEVIVEVIPPAQDY